MTNEETYSSSEYGGFIPQSYLDRLETRDAKREELYLLRDSLAGLRDDWKGLIETFKPDE